MKYSKSLLITAGLLLVTTLGTSCTSSGPSTKRGSVADGITGAVLGSIVGNQSGRPLEGAAIGGIIGSAAECNASEVLKIRIIKTLHQINIINPHLLSSIIVIIIIRKFLGPQEGTGFQHHREGTGFQRHGDQFISTIINNNFGIRKIQLRKKMPLLPFLSL